jgi:hypothetical protein
VEKKGDFDKKICHLPIEDHFFPVLGPVVDGVGKRLDEALQVNIGAKWSSQQLVWHFDYWSDCKCKLN